MKLNAFLISLTVVMVSFTIFTIVTQARKNPDAFGSTANSAGTEPSGSELPERSLLAKHRSLILTGVRSQVPEADEYVCLPTVPWDMKSILTLFRDAGVQNSCELLEFGTDIIQPLIEPVADTAGPLGRQSAFSIRLQLGKELGEGLPGVTRGIISDYLRSHQLTIQPSYYHTESQQLVLSPRLRAAFVRLDSPEKCVEAEPMIASSIQELRTLGVYWNSEEKFVPAACRTLILGFRYVLDADKSKGRATAQSEFELLFLHLLKDASPTNPRLAVFATSDGRTQFHLLELTEPDNPAQMAAITADVRFSDTKLLGMYPENPVVTSVKHRALLSVPVDLVKSQIQGLGDNAPDDGFSGVLDKLYVTAIGDSQKPVESSEATTPENLNAVPEFSDPVPTN